MSLAKASFCVGERVEMSGPVGIWRPGRVEGVGVSGACLCQVMSVWMMQWYERRVVLRPVVHWFGRCVIMDLRRMDVVLFVTKIRSILDAFCVEWKVMASGDAAPVWEYRCGFVYVWASVKFLE